MTKEEFKLIENIMIEEMTDSAHDAEHVYRVLSNALMLSEGENIDVDVLITACLLHDIGRKEQNANSQLCHAQVGAKKAKQLLIGLGKDLEFIEKVTHCILTHRFRKNNMPKTMEAKILFDADKLDVTGAIGIARTLMYQGMMGYALNGKQNSFFAEYDLKLSKIDDKFLTEKGRKEALRRSKARNDFYNALKEEIKVNDISRYLK